MTIAGQRTCAFEALTSQVPPVEAVLCPIGGGGPAAGTVLAVEATGPGARDFAVEPDQADDTARSFGRAAASNSRRSRPRPMRCSPGPPLS